jgi:hypothetical protein
MHMASLADAGESSFKYDADRTMGIQYGLVLESTNLAKMDLVYASCESEIVCASQSYVI